jgi:hypothetical protein
LTQLTGLYGATISAELVDTVLPVKAAISIAEISSGDGSGAGSSGALNRNDA